MAFAIFLAAVILVYLAAPEQVAAHRDTAGEVTRTESRERFALIMGAIGFGLWLLFAFGHRLLARAPAWALNVPHPQYWASPEGRPQLARLLRQDLGWIGVMTLALMTPLTLVVAMSEGPVRMWPIWVGLSFYLVAMLGYCLWMATGGRYRPPPEWLDARSAPHAAG